MEQLIESRISKSLLNSSNKEQKISPLKEPQFWIILGSILIVPTAVIFLIFNQTYFEQVKTLLTEIKLIQWMINLSLVYLFYKSIIFLFLIYHYIKYKPIKPVASNKLPSISIIVPAYNEGALVYETINSICKSEYPEDKIEIIAIDDGSKDDTWNWISKAKYDQDLNIETIQFAKNQGKRKALYEGIKRSKGEIIITIDSDSIIDKNTLINLVSPFVDNPKCGAVAGNVKVLNNNSKYIIPKMLNISFTFSFEFIRAAQSNIKKVFCTPGALSAYRKDNLINVLEEWLNQKFLGKISDIGEDRAMTNLILKQGYDVVFQSNAYVYTQTPESYKQLKKMYIRWERSNIRENLMMTQFAFFNYKGSHKLGLQILLIDQIIRIIVSIPFFLFLVYLLIMHPFFILVSSLIGVGIFSGFQSLFYGVKYNWKDSLWAISYGIFYAFSLVWITPYSIATAGKSGWLTR